MRCRGAEFHTVRSGENPSTIAREYGVDFSSIVAINGINPGEITKKAKQALSDLIAQSYGLMAYRRALAILKDDGIAKSEAVVSDFAYRFDLPDADHDDLVIYYKFQS